MHFLSVKCTIFYNSLTFFGSPLWISPSFFVEKPQCFRLASKKGRIEIDTFAISMDPNWADINAKGERIKFNRKHYN